ncbi:MAG TPA: hypothetical protein ENF55_01920 [Thermoprotei archaeon]|nr:hypothetical protein [Thermoprotei archaeon]
MTLVVKKIDEKKLREFKAEAIRRGLTFSRALEEAIDLWLKRSVLETDLDVNNRAYLRMKDNLDKYKGRYVVFAHGKFIGAYSSLEEVGRALKAIKPRPRHAIVLKVGYDHKVERDLEWWGGSIELKTA